MQYVVNVVLYSITVIIAKVLDVSAQQRAADNCNDYYGPLDTRPSIAQREISGVQAAQTQDLPFIVALGYEVEDEIKYFCAGSLISDNFVITAAQCIHSERGGTVKYVRIGDRNLNTTEDDERVQMFTVKRNYVHPEYKFPEKYHDIALIKLNRCVKFSGFITRPICLSLGETPRRYITGSWGQLEYESKFKNVLQITKLIPYEISVCVRNFTADVTLPNGVSEEHQICAGFVIEDDEIVDTCQGDFGGPLAYTQRKAFYLAGVTSFGKPCVLGIVPGLYTSVSSHIVWIENIVWPSHYSEVDKENLLRDKTSHSNRLHSRNNNWTVLLLLLYVYLFVNCNFFCNK